MLLTNFHLKYGLYKLVGAGFQLFDVGRMHPVRERARRALAKTVDYIEANMPDALGFTNQRELLSYALSQVPTEGSLAEFGVYKGGTLRFMAKKLPTRIFHGFDSFTGLPEAWSGFDLAKGAFSLGGALPSMPANVALHKGFFEKSLPAWKAAHADKIAFAHIDCDLYSSTKTVLSTLHDRFITGTIILFDEYFNYPGWENHEFKAWHEHVRATGLNYRYIGYARQQAAVQIISLGTSHD